MLCSKVIYTGLTKTEIGNWNSDGYFHRDMIFKSNLEFRYQIIVPSIKLRKGFAKFLIPIALFTKVLSQQFIASVEVSNIVR